MALPITLADVIINRRLLQNKPQNVLLRDLNSIKKINSASIYTLQPFPRAPGDPKPTSDDRAGNIRNAAFVTLLPAEFNNFCYRNKTPGEEIAIVPKGKDEPGSYFFDPLVIKKKIHIGPKLYP